MLPPAFRATEGRQHSALARLFPHAELSGAKLRSWRLAGGSSLDIAPASCSEWQPPLEIPWQLSRLWGDGRWWQVVLKAVPRISRSERTKRPQLRARPSCVPAAWPGAARAPPAAPQRCTGVQEPSACLSVVVSSCLAPLPHEPQEEGSGGEKGSAPARALRRENLRCVKPELLNISSSILRESNLYI